MKPVGVFYATREGHSRRVAEAVAVGLRRRGVDASCQEVAGNRAGTLDAYAGVVLVASVHLGRHEREMIRFVRYHREGLDGVPNAFVSVTLSQAGVQRADATPQEHAQFFADVRAMRDRFIAETGWQPRRTLDVAGALAYSKYGLLLRLAMKRIARKAGGSTDTSRDHDYTDWNAVDAFTAALASELTAPA
jgi:menaquinone-dependent protoporphyrinogen oxidase